MTHFGEKGGDTREFIFRFSKSDHASAVESICGPKWVIFEDFSQEMTPSLQRRGKTGYKAYSRPIRLFGVLLRWWEILEKAFHFFDLRDIICILCGVCIGKSILGELDSHPGKLILRKNFDFSRVNLEFFDFFTRKFSRFSKIRFSSGKSDFKNRDFSRFFSRFSGSWISRFRARFSALWCVISHARAKFPPIFIFIIFYYFLLFYFFFRFPFPSPIFLFFNFL